MTNPNFSHPADPSRVPLFPDLYYQYYDLLKVRAQLRQEMSQALEASYWCEPRLPPQVQAQLEQLEHEADHDRDHDHDRDARRARIFAAAHATGLKAWQGESTDIPDPTACRVRLHYCDYCCEQLRARIETLRANTTLKDPFNLLDEKFDLTDDELEILIFLYHHQFERPEPITGAALLEAVIGRQSSVFRGQAILFDASTLLTGGLLTAVTRGNGALDTTFALSRTANLIISGLHADYPLQVVRWTVTDRLRAETAAERGLSWDDTVVYAGHDAERAVELARWCFGVGKQLQVARPGTPDLMAVPCFAIVVEPEFTARTEWVEYLAYRNEVLGDDPGDARAEATIIHGGERCLCEITGELAGLCPAITCIVEAHPK